MAHILLRFVLLGSFIAGGVFLAVRTLASAGEPIIANVLLEFLALPLEALLASFLSIPFGFLPASGAALLYWTVLHRNTVSNPPPALRAALGGLTGAISSGLFGGLLFSSSDAPGSYTFLANVVAWVVAGSAGGAASALIAGNGTYAAAFKLRQSNRGA